MKVGLIQPPLPSLFPLNQSFRLATDRCHKLRDPNKSFRFFCLHSWEYGSQQTHHDHILLCCALCSVQGVVGGRRCPCIISTGGRPNFLLKYLGIYHKNKVSFLSLIEYFCLPNECIRDQFLRLEFLIEFYWCSVRPHIIVIEHFHSFILQYNYIIPILLLYCSNHTPDLTTLFTPQPKHNHGKRVSIGNHMFASVCLGLFLMLLIRHWYAMELK